MAPIGAAREALQRAHPLRASSRPSSTGPRTWRPHDLHETYVSVAGVGYALAVLALHAVAAAAQVPAGAPAVRPESAVVVPGSIYRAGAVGRFLFGDHYRDLWTAQLTVPVLSLEHFAGGLRPLKRGGSRQTKSLRFAAGDGQEYVFRSVDKDPSASLPSELRGTYADRIMRDLISAAHPGGALVVAELLDAVRVLHATPQLAVMPNDARLGEFQKEFAGVLGLIEVRPANDSETDDATSDPTKVVSSEKLFERITKHSDEQADARTFLAARLFDMFVGDWDRHPDQWRWIRLGDSRADRWQPIPRDRDWALVKLDGLVWSLARFTYPFPQFVTFDAEYPDVVWLTWNGRRLDRRLLSELERPVWDSVATALRDRLSDAAIEDAIRRLPPELAAASGNELRRILAARRDRIPEIARRFYRVLADEVEVHATDDSELVEITRTDDRFSDVVIRQRTRSGAARERIWLRRRFDSHETREIRVFLHGGDDRVVVRGPGAAAILVRVIGGGGRNTFADSTLGGGASRVRYYDTTEASTASDAKRIDRREFKEPKTRRGWMDPPRDWGSRWRPLPWVSYSPELGVFAGGGPLYKRYGFRHHPYAYSMSLRVGYATGANRWRAEYEADARRSNSNVHGTLRARASGIDILRFYGFGNETSKLGSSAYHTVHQQVVSLEPLLHVPLADNLDLSVGATVRYASTELESGRFIAATRPYGTGGFGQVGARQGLTYDTRDVAANASRGVFVSIEGAQYPAVWSARRPFAQLRSQAATYLGTQRGMRPVLALRVGGDKLWGEYPFSDAAFIGGASTVRGFAEERFAGAASAYGNAELRVFLTRIFLLLPADLGAFGLADAGRVFQPGEQSDSWHRAFGGGLWVSFLGRANTFSVSAARSREGTGFHVRSGMLF